MNRHSPTLFINGNSAKTVRILTIRPAQFDGLVLDSAAVSAPLMVEVLEFEIVGNSLIPAAEIQKLPKPHLGQQSLKGVSAASQTLQNWDIRAGHTGVVTSAPVQTISNGKVCINVLAGKLDQVVVQGNERFSDQNVKAGLPSLKLGPTPNLVDLNTHTLTVNENPAKSVRVVFQPGLRIGQLDAPAFSPLANARHSPHALISADQFGMGGATTVRGFIERKLVGDQGAETSVEWSTLLLGALQSSGQSGGNRQLLDTAFIDAGIVNNHLGTVCKSGKTTCSIAGAGTGLTLSQDRHWSLKADLARALTAGTTTQRGHYRLHFLARLAF